MAHRMMRPGNTNLPRETKNISGDCQHGRGNMDYDDNMQLFTNYVNLV